MLLLWLFVFDPSSPRPRTLALKRSLLGAWMKLTERVLVPLGVEELELLQETSRLVFE